jgi:hypothetical protein
MAVASRSHELGRFYATGGAAVEILTVPDGQVWLVKRLLTYSRDSTVQAYVYIDPLAFLVVRNLVLGANEIDDHETWWALEPGTYLAIYNAGPGEVSGFVFGAKLVGG